MSWYIFDISLNPDPRGFMIFPPGPNLTLLQILGRACFGKVCCAVVLCCAGLCCVLLLCVVCCILLFCAAFVCCVLLCCVVLPCVLLLILCCAVLCCVLLLLCCAANIVRCAAGHKVGAGANWEETPQQFYPKPQNFYRKISPPVERKRRREEVQWKTYCFENSNGCLKGSLPAIDLSMDWRTHDGSLLDFNIIFTLLSLDLINGQFNDVVSLRSVANLKGFNNFFAEMHWRQNGFCTWCPF